VFHRVDDLEAMPAERFFSYVGRLLSYDGALRFAALHPPEPEFESDEDALMAHTSNRPAATNFLPGTYTRVAGPEKG
jgi:hypothetical protein